jgi:hypothetical protein
MSGLRPTLTLIVFICALIVLLVACGGNENVPFVRDEQVLVTCSEECANRGQCGVMTDERRAVLANESGPAVTLQDRFFIEGATVVVVESSQRELFAALDGAPLIAETTPFPHMFYRVSGEGKTAWVSEWCLARP